MQAFTRAVAGAKIDPCTSQQSLIICLDQSTVQTDTCTKISYYALSGNTLSGRAQDEV